MTSEIDAYLTAEDRPKVKRDRWGRYVLNHPQTGGEEPWQRVTTFTRITADEYALGKWQQRMTLKGASIRDDIVAVAYSLDVKKDAKQMDGLVEDLKDAAGGSKSANLGTALHSFAETLDHGGSLDDVPPVHRADIKAYRDTMQAHGIGAATGMVERITCVPKYQVAGTFDLIVHIPKDSVLGRRWGLTADMHVIGDRKTGRDLSFNWTEIAIQLALYSIGVNEVGVWNAVTGTWDDAPRVSRDFGIVIHMPVGEAECTLYSIDLERGARAAELSAKVRDWRKNKGLATPLDTYEPPMEKLMVIEWEDQFRAVKSRVGARELYFQAKADPRVDAARLARLVALGRAALGKTSS